MDITDITFGSTTCGFDKASLVCGSLTEGLKVGRAGLMISLRLPKLDDGWPESLEENSERWKCDFVEGSLEVKLPTIWAD